MARVVPVVRARAPGVNSRPGRTRPYAIEPREHPDPSTAASRGVLYFPAIAEKASNKINPLDTLFTSTHHINLRTNPLSPPPLRERGRGRGKRLSSIHLRTLNIVFDLEPPPPSPASPLRERANALVRFGAAPRIFFSFITSIPIPSPPRRQYATPRHPTMSQNDDGGGGSVSKGIALPLPSKTLTLRSTSF